MVSIDNGTVGSVCHNFTAAYFDYLYLKYPKKKETFCQIPVFDGIDVCYNDISIIVKTGWFKKESVSIWHDYRWEDDVDDCVKIRVINRIMEETNLYKGKYKELKDENDLAYDQRKERLKDLRKSLKSRWCR